MKNVYFDKLLWIDTEFSTLELEKALLLEIAVVVTDSDFNELASEAFVIHNHENDLELMKSELIEHNPEKPEFDQVVSTYDLHENSGLLDLVRKSTNTTLSVENELLGFINRHFEGEKPILAGNSINFDKTILKYHMPRLHKRLHYRVLDVSSLKMVYLNTGKPAYEKRAHHRALDDIRESIEELKYLLSLNVG